jgi:CheY-like chemotaxis protein
VPIIPDRSLRKILSSQITEAKREPVENPMELFKLNEFFLGKTILIADNDFRNTYALASALEMKGFNVITVSNGVQAVDELKKENKIDLILMDIMMPVMDGYTAIREIRKMEKCKELPIIALTAKSMKGDRSKCILAGASDYLSKPVNWDNLFLLLPAWL